MSTDHPLLAYRKAHDLSLDAVASKLGVNKSTVLRWESGAVPVPVGRLSDISSLTGIAREALRPDIFGAQPAPAPEVAA